MGLMLSQCARGTAPVTHPPECGENQITEHFLVLGKSSIRLLSSRDLEAGLKLGPQAQVFLGKGCVIGERQDNTLSNRREEAY